MFNSYVSHYQRVFTGSRTTAGESIAVGYGLFCHKMICPKNHHCLNWGKLMEIMGCNQPWKKQASVSCVNCVFAEIQSTHLVAKIYHSTNLTQPSVLSTSLMSSWLYSYCHNNPSQFHTIYNCLATAALTKVLEATAATFGATSVPSAAPSAGVSGKENPAPSTPGLERLVDVVEEGRCPVRRGLGPYFFGAIWKHKGENHEWFICKFFFYKRIVVNVGGYMRVIIMSGIYVGRFCRGDCQSESLKQLGRHSVVGSFNCRWVQGERTNL